jgi:uncharacterized membrane protein SpoIIM required for sporulation
MQPEELYKSRKSDWALLASLLERAERNLRQFSPEDVETLGNLYRAATSDLALARRDFPHHQIVTYLNRLVARGHAVVYRGEPLALRRLIHFVTIGFPRLFRETLPFTFAAFLMFIIPAVLAGVIANRDPRQADWLLPPQVQDMVEYLENQDLWTEIPVNQRPYASSFIMQNNIQVSFLAFGYGITGGIMTMWIMALNGLILGGITGVADHYNMAFELWTFVIGHGVIELSVIFMAGGSGLMLGWSILRPGLMRRRDSLAQAAGKAVRLLIGAVPLLVVAGTIEGFISPAENIPWPIKWGIGIGSGIILYGYLFLAGWEKHASYKTG